MNRDELVQHRYQNQLLQSPAINDPVELVKRLGAVQAQEYPGAAWGLGLRLKQGNETTIDKAFASGKILRTHALRPTWHFVVPGDIRWILSLNAARVKPLMAPYCRKLELTDAVLKRSRQTLEKIMKDGKQLTRPEIAAALNKAKIRTDEMRMNFLLIDAELDGVICNGPKRGKQFTYTLLEEWVPSFPKLTRDESLTELVRKYFHTRGPATVKDCAWWSGLTMADVKKGIEMVKDEFLTEKIEGNDYWFPDRKIKEQETKYHADLLATYDEYLIAYKDREAMFDTKMAAKAGIAPKFSFVNTILLNGKVIGGWSRKFIKDKVEIETGFYGPLNKQQMKAVDEAIQCYCEFTGKERLS